MVVLVIVSILAAVAYPSYLQSVKRGYRSEARIALLEAQAKKQEEHAAGQGAASGAEGDTAGPDAEPLKRMFTFLEQARAVAKLRAAQRAERAATAKGEGKGGEPEAAAVAAVVAAEAETDSLLDGWGALDVDGGDGGERERFETFKKRYREVEADYELCKPPMFKPKTAGASGCNP